MPTKTKKKSASRAEAIRKRKAKKRREAILLRAVLVFTVLLIVVGAVFMVSKMSGGSSESLRTDVFRAGVTFEGQSLEGLTMEEATAQVKAQVAALGWDMQVKCHADDPVPVDNLLEAGIPAMLTEAYAQGNTGTTAEQEAKRADLILEPAAYDVMDLYSRDRAASFAKRLASQKNTKLTPAVLSGYDEELGELEFSDPVPGQILDENDLVLRIEEALEARDFDAVLNSAFVDEFPADQIPAEYSVEALRDQYERIGNFKTETSRGNAARDTNITLASEAVSGTVVKPGETFSILDAIGGTTPEKGYQSAGAYVNGELVDDIGGGICQVSTTLYNAVVKAGLNTTERHNHSMTVGYVELGEDAMISYPSSDFQFVNNSEGTILIRMWYRRNEVHAEVYGIPLLAEGVTVAMVATSTEELAMPATEYIEDPTLEPGTEQIVSHPIPGYKVVTYLVTYQDGVEISRAFLHNSTYKSKGAVIRRNSAVETTPEETVPEETLPAETEPPVTDPTDGTAGTAQPEPGGSDVNGQTNNQTGGQ